MIFFDAAVLKSVPPCDASAVLLFPQGVLQDWQSCRQCFFSMLMPHLLQIVALQAVLHRRQCVLPAHDPVVALYCLQCVSPSDQSCLLTDPLRT